MYKALVLKELRETIGVAATALLAYLALDAFYMGYAVLFFSYTQDGMKIPFLQDNYLAGYVCISIVYATSLGFWQTVGENNRGTWLFLLHRSMPRWQIIGTKLAVGATLYLSVSVLSILIYALWAATPGTHSNPFYWWMTKAVCWSWLVILICYLGAFISGLRPGSWIGTRLLPVPAAGLMALFCGFLILAVQWELLGSVVVAVFCAILIGTVFYIAKTRDFSR